MLGATTGYAVARAPCSMRAMAYDLGVVIERSPVAVAVFLLDGPILAVNVAFAALLGCAKDDLEGKPYWDLTAKGQRQHELNEILARRGHAFHKELVARDGRQVSVASRGFVVEERDGETVLAVFVQPLATVDEGDRGVSAARVLRRQNAHLFELARSEAIDRGDLGAAAREITEACAGGMECSRASVWLYDEHRTQIACLDLFEAEKGQHTSGATLTAEDYPGYFEALASDRAITADDAHTHPATREFYASYLAPLGIASMLDAPIRRHGKLVGVLCHEHVGPMRPWTLEEQSFASSIADIVSRALDSSERRRAEEALHRANEELEARVSQRTTALKTALDALWGEMALAQRLQHCLVPERIAVPGFAVAGHMCPSEQAGGDYYDVIDAPGAAWIAIGDAAGQGVAAGLVMTMCQTALRALVAGQPSITPAELLSAVHGVLAYNIDRLGEARHMALSVLRHAGEGRFEHAGLHLPMLIHRAESGDVESLPSAGMALGSKAGKLLSLVPSSFDLGPGDTLLLYTDGIVDATVGAEKLGLDGLRKALRRLGGEPAHAIRDGLVATVEDAVVQDDITLLVIQRAAPSTSR